MRRRPRRVVAAALIVALAFFGLLALDMAVALHPHVLASWVKRMILTKVNAGVSVASAQLDPSGHLKIEKLRLTTPHLKALFDRLDLSFNTADFSPLSLRGRLKKMSLKIGPNWSFPVEQLLKPSRETAHPAKIPTVFLQIEKAELTLAPLDGTRVVVRDGQLFLCQSGQTLCLSFSGEVEGVGTLTAEVQIEGGRIEGQAALKTADISEVLKRIPRRLLVEGLDSIKGGNLRAVAIFSLNEGKLRADYTAVLKDGRFSVPMTDLIVNRIEAVLTGRWKGDSFRAGCVGEALVPSGGRCSFTLDISGPKDLSVALDAWACGVEINEQLKKALPIAKDVFDVLHLEGRADCRFTLSHAKKLEYRLRFFCRPETSVEVRWFPYRVTNLKGTVELDAEKVAFRAESLMPGGRIAAEGLFSMREDCYRVRVEGRGVEVDERIKAALPEEVADVLDRLGVSGSVPFVVEVEKTARDQMDWSVEVEMAGLKLLPHDMPVEVVLESGRLSVRESGVVFRDVKGSVAGGRFRVRNFTIPYKSGDFMAFVHGCNIKIDKDLLRMLLEKVGLDADEWEAEGQADTTLRFVSRGGEFHFSGEARLKRMRLLYNPFPVTMEDAEGLLRFSETGFEVVALEGKAGGGTAAVWGEVAKTEGDWKTRLRIEAFGVVVDERLRRALPDFAREYFDLFRPRGQADFACHLDGSPEDLKCSLTITLRHCSATVPDFPYPITDLSGSVRIDVGTGAVLLEQLRARDGAIVVNGSSLPQGKNRLTQLTIKLRGLEVDDDLLEAVPGGEFLADLNFAGHISGLVNLNITQNRKTTISYTARLHPVKCSLNAGVEFDNISGAVLISGMYDGENHLEPIRLDLRGVRVYGFEIERVGCVMSVGEEEVKFSDLKGSVYGGRLSGKVKVTGEAADITLSVSRASVRRAAEQLFEEKMERVTGYVSASFSGRLGKDVFTGKGKIRMRRANLWQVPFFSELVRVLSLGAVEGVPFHKAGATFELKNDRIRFSNAYFYSAIIGLKGRGSLHYDGKLRFKFAIKIAPSIMKYLPLVNWIIDFIKNNMVEILVRGTPKRPKIILAPFQPLVDFFRSEE